MEIQKRLGAVQAEIQNPAKSADNPFYKSKYAPLPEILEIVRPLCAKHGLAIVQYPETRVEEATAMIGVRTFLSLAGTTGEGSGEGMLDCGWVGISSQGLDAQKVGAVITYFRRYSIKSIFAIEAEDDDANSAVAAPAKTAGTKPAAQQKGNAAEIKKKWFAARTPAEQDAVLSSANTLSWTDVDHQDLAVFFETELAKRNAPTKQQAPKETVDEQTTIPGGR